MERGRKDNSAKRTSVLIELNVEDGQLKNADDLPPMSLESKLMSEELKSCGTKDLDTFDSSE